MKDHNTQTVRSIPLRITAFLIVLTMACTAMASLPTEVFAATSTAGYYFFNNHTYKIFEEVVDWHTAKKYCENIGGHLATITSSEEQDFIEKLLPESHDYYWLGGTDEDDEGNFTWITGEPFSYSNWCVNNPGGSENFIGILARPDNFDGYNQERGWWNDYGKHCISNVSS